MSLPITRKDWQERSTLLAGIVPFPDEREAIEGSANWLIERLYEPEAKLGWRASRESIEAAGIALRGEPINWGDLMASVEQRGDDVFVVTLEEATEGQCPTLCAYIEDWLKRWGWENVEVVTEW